ncbi:MAG: AraC family transcriptional regulator [Candidatus Amoebophilus sp. 36-38]|nr:MAG: AraC family transcriptional regulator [Candidatus Amoebophilus sp. 36-38]
MKHLSILLLEQVNLAGMENARQSFLETNAYLNQQGQPPMFEVNLVSITPEVRINDGLYTIQANQLIKQVQKTDIIIIPPIQNELFKAIQDNQAFIPWIKSQYENGAQVISLCIGAFILGSTGLLDGKRCVTHWRAAQEFQNLFPKVELVTDKLLTDEQGIYTGGGAFSSANLLLYFIEKTVGRDAAIYCSKIFQIDMGRKSQSCFIIFNGQKDHADEEVRLVQAYIEEHYNRKLTVEVLCKYFGMSRRTFERRFKKATDNTVLEYIQRVKVEAAKRELEKGRKTVKEVMFEVGYFDTKAFRDIFKKHAGHSPSEYKNKYELVQ